MTVNADRLHAVLDHIKAHPEQHLQETWGRRTECGTVACFAGWTVLLFKPGIAERFAAAPMREPILFIETLTPYAALAEITDVSSTARDLLGLTVDQASTLFHAENTAGQLEKMINLLVSTGGTCDGYGMRITAGVQW